MLRWIVTLVSLTGLISSCSSGSYNNYIPPGAICRQDHKPFPLEESELKPSARVKSIDPQDRDLDKLPPGDYQYLGADFVYFKPQASKKNPKQTDNIYLHAHADARPGKDPGTYIAGAICTVGIKRETPDDFGGTINVIKSMKISKNHEVTFKMMQIGFTDGDKIKYIFADQASGNRVLRHPEQIFGRQGVKYVLWQEDPVAAKDIYEIRGKFDRGTHEMWFNVKMQRKDEPIPSPSVNSVSDNEKKTAKNK